MDRLTSPRMTAETFGTVVDSASIADPRFWHLDKSQGSQAAALRLILVGADVGDDAAPVHIQTVAGLALLRVVARRCRQLVVDESLAGGGRADVRVVIVIRSDPAASRIAALSLEEGIGSMVRSLTNEYGRAGLRLNAIAASSSRIDPGDIGVLIGTLFEDRGAAYLGQTLRMRAERGVHA